MLVAEQSHPFSIVLHVQYSCLNFVSAANLEPDLDLFEFLVAVLRLYLQFSFAAATKLFLKTSKCCINILQQTSCYRAVLLNRHFALMKRIPQHISVLLYRHSFYTETSGGLTWCQYNRKFTSFAYFYSDGSSEM